MAEAPAQRSGGLPARSQSDLFEGLGSLNILRQLGLLIGLAASVAIGVAVVLWAQGKDYLPLYADLERMDPADVMQILQTNEIPFKIDEKSGALLVAADQLYKARLQLAGAGISPDGSFGFELLDQQQPLGTSQFMESARFKRSLEGELARTITSIRAVRGARVHLAIPESSSFIRDRRKPSASVFVDLYTGAGLTPEQVRAIANLVASSISEMQLEDVTVVDQRGKLLSNFSADAEMAMANKQLEYVQQVEQRLAKRIDSILAPLLGEGRFRAEVSADIDFTQIEQADEVFSPDGPVIRSEQTMEESRGGAAVGGVPGALSNQPPATGQAPEQVAAGAGAAAGADGKPAGTSRVQAVRNYELDRTISYTRYQTGRLQRLSVAVVVDHQRVTDPDSGETSSQPLPAEELDRLTALIRDAVGYSAERGDSVNVISQPFIPTEVPPEPEIAETPLWQQPWVLQLARQLGAVFLVLFLIFGVLRPVMKSLTDNARDARELEASRALGEFSGDLGDIGNATVTLSGGDNMLLPGPNENYEQQVNAIKGLIAEDPGRVAQVVKSWVASGE